MNLIPTEWVNTPEKAREFLISHEAGLLSWIAGYGFGSCETKDEEDIAATQRFGWAITYDLREITEAYLKETTAELKLEGCDVSAADVLRVVGMAARNNGFEHDVFVGLVESIEACRGRNAA